jgi:hypothetical protein
LVQKIDTTAQLISFNDETLIHFFAIQNESGEYREHAIHEYDGSFYYTLASGFVDAPDFVEEECATLHQAYAHLIRNLDVPL